MNPLLAQAVSSEFLIDPVKPVLALAVAAIGCALTSRLAKDIQFCGLPSKPWHTKMIAGVSLGLLAVLLVPTFYAGFPLQLALTAAPFVPSGRMGSILKGPRLSAQPVHWFTVPETTVVVM